MILNLNKYASFLLLLVLALLSPRIATSQISLTTENLALGGGGTAYLTGFEALFVNPANLYIQEKNYRFQISVLQGGIYYDTLLPIRNNIDRFDSFIDHTKIYDFNTTLPEIQSNEYEKLLDRNYPRNNTSRDFLTESDFYWFGLKWVRPQRSYAISMRTRVASRYDLGKGLFSSDPVERDNTSILDRSLQQNIQVFHELSFGYAESFTFLNGLLPQLSEFIIGIAPKIVVSGASLDVDYTDRYQFDSELTAWDHTTGYSQMSSGILSEYGEQFFNSTGEPVVQNNYSFNDLLRPAGIGAGLDIGITYLITFSDDLSVLREQNAPTEKSLRVSLSVTDLGAVYQSKTPHEYQTETQSEYESLPGSVSETLFMGAPNEHYSFLSQFEDFPNSATANTQNGESYEVLLPASIQAGALFQYQRIKLVGDFSYSLSDSPFNHSGLASYIGMELRPVPFLPVRGGTRFAKEMAGTYSFGTGVETNRFDLNVSLQLKSRNAGPTTEIVGASLFGLKIYL